MKNLIFNLLSTVAFTLFSYSTAFGNSSFVSLNNEISSPTLVIKIEKLKRTLLKNLVRDELIASKKEFVKMELPDGKIIINGKALEGKLNQKYEQLLLSFEITHGEKRAIHISPNFIKVGDFYADCFRGSASGRMSISICGDEKTKKSLFD